MKIAIPTNDKETIALRTGKSKWFGVYQISDNEVVSVEFRKNTHSHEHGHDEPKHGEGEGHHAHSHKEIIDMLSDCDVVLLKHIGKHMKSDMEAANIRYKKVKAESIDELIRSYIKG